MSEVNPLMEEYIDAGVNIIFKFGTTGVGKTCFLAIIYQYLRSNSALILNMANKDGIKHINNILKDLLDNKLPSSSSMLKVKEVDIGLKIKGKYETYTFLDMSGEDLRSLDPSEPNVIGKSGDLQDKFSQYLTYEGVNTKALCFIESTDALKQDILTQTFLSYLKDCNFDLSKVAIIITKWDLIQDKSFEDFVKENIPATLVWMKDEIGEPSVFPFSIGDVQDSDPQILERLDLQYCDEIVNWLMLSNGINGSKKLDPKISQNFIISLVEAIGSLFKKLVS